MTSLAAVLLIAGQLTPIPSTPLEAKRTAGTAAFSRPTRHGKLEVFHEDPFDGEGPNALMLVSARGALSCERPGNMICSDRVEVTTVGKLLLACVPKAIHVHDLCVGNGKGRLFDTGRECTLIDLERRRCHLLPFLDARLNGKGTLTVLQVAWGSMKRLPGTLDELLAPEQLECGRVDGGPAALRLSSWGPSVAIRAELSFDGTFHFLRSVDLKGFSDQDGVIEHQALQGCTP